MSTETINYRFKVRGGTAANLATVNEVPLSRELVVETDTGKMKLGDGVTPYNDLGYISSGGVDGFEMRVDSGYIQYTTDGVEWENLVAVEDLKGPPGADSTVPGPPGPVGGPSGIVANTGPVTVNASHKNNWLLQSSGDVTFPVPSSIGFVNGDFVNVRRQAGTVGFVAGVGASLDFNDALFAPSINALKDSVAVVAHGDAWMLVGPLEAL